MTVDRHGGSFRDPAGYLFERHGTLLRRVEHRYAEDWYQLHESGLLDLLQTRRMLVGHEELLVDPVLDRGAFRIIRPDRIPFVSYPYEWTTSQLQAAALLTLRVERAALDHGMTLKDASAYNIQFLGHRPVFIDTLSFMKYQPGAPWPAYRQFCQHFLAPLALMTGVDTRLRDLLRTYLDGVPLDLASRLLAPATWLRPSQLLHIHLHSRSVQRLATRSVAPAIARRGVSPAGREGLLAHLESAVTSLKASTEKTEWADYEAVHNYSTEGQLCKESAIDRWVAMVRPRLVVDLGANTGHYSKRIAELGAYVVAIDGDSGAAESLCRRLMVAGDERVLPLWMDLTNPSPSHGWAHREREALVDRGGCDLVLALALVHHLAIGNNVPLPELLDYFARLGSNAIVEWVPKDDPQVRRLLVSRSDIFADYGEQAFLHAAESVFNVVERVAVPGNGRALYLLGPR